MKDVMTPFPASDSPCGYPAWFHIAYYPRNDLIGDMMQKNHLEKEKHIRCTAVLFPVIAVSVKQL